jgi:hypothetical protein
MRYETIARDHVERLPLYDYPQRAEDSMEHKISVDVSSGPIGGDGFRTGWWPIQIDGRAARVFASVSRHAELDEQERQVVEAARRCIELNDIGTLLKFDRA